MMLVKSWTLLRAQRRERIFRKELLVLSYFEKLYHFEVCLRLKLARN